MGGVVGWLLCEKQEYRKFLRLYIYIYIYIYIIMVNGKIKNGMCVVMVVI